MGKLTIQQRPKCIFCQLQNKVSREHVFPKWLKKLHPNGPNDVWRQTAWQDDRPGGGIIDLGSKSKNGTVLDFQVYGPCVICNNGWMSEIENSCKPLLLDLIDGKSFKVSAAQQALLASWAALKFMVHDWHEPQEGQAISQEERTAFFLTRRIPETWKIRVAVSAEPLFAECTLNKCHVWRTELDGPEPSIEARARPNTIVNQLIVGHLTIVCMASRSRHVQELFLTIPMRLALRTIHPGDGADFSWPPPVRLTPQQSEGLILWNLNTRYVDTFGT